MEMTTKQKGRASYALLELFHCQKSSINVSGTYTVNFARDVKDARFTLETAICLLGVTSDLFKKEMRQVEDWEAEIGH